MKIKPEHVEIIRKAIVPFDNPTNRSVYRKLKHSDMSYRWDLVRLAGLIPFFRNTIYDYANDDHIDTVLKKVVPSLYLEEITQD